MLLYSNAGQGNENTRAALTEENLKKVITLFSLDMPTGHIVKATGIPLAMVESLLREVRKKLAERCADESPLERIHLTDLELDEEIQVLGVVQKGSKMYMEPVPGLHNDLLAEIQQRKEVGLEALEAMGIGKKYCALIPIQGGYAMQLSRPEGSEEFWKMISTKMPFCQQTEKADAYLHLKECEFRYNYPIN